ncbi:15287_t:CDS:1, partial [Acaulospora colombiana]
MGDMESGWTDEAGEDDAELVEAEPVFAFAFGVLLVVADDGTATPLNS